jgi:hypothetical protein
MAMIDVSPRIALRLVVDGSGTTAEAVWAQVTHVLADLTLVTEATIKPYWKIPNTQEISGTLRPSAGSLDDAYEEIARRLASGWAEQTNDEFARWTVWNRGDGNFIAPGVRWAHVELIRA